MAAPSSLGLGHVVDRFAVQAVANAPVELGDFLFAEGIGQGQHGHAVLDRGKAGRWLGTDALGGRIGGDQVGMVGFQCFEFAQQPVVLGIAYDRVVQDVVAVVVVVELAAQAIDTFGYLHRAEPLQGFLAQAMAAIELAHFLAHLGDALAGDQAAGVVQHFGFQQLGHAPGGGQHRIPGIQRADRGRQGREECDARGCRTRSSSTDRNGRERSGWPC